MKKFTTPLDNIRVASPCKADWNHMYGNDRKRFCADCKLNVYNLSDMTRDEAENFLMASEGRTCVRYFRRADGAVLTRNCPVGWRAVRQRISKTATAVFSVVAGFFGGLFAFGVSEVTVPSATVGQIAPVSRDVESDWQKQEPVPTTGILDQSMTEIEGRVDPDDFRRAKDKQTTTFEIMGGI